MCRVSDACVRFVRGQGLSFRCKQEASKGSTLGGFFCWIGRRFQPTRSTSFACGLIWQRSCAAQSGRAGSRRALPPVRRWNVSRLRHGHRQSASFGSPASAPANQAPSTTPRGHRHGELFEKMLDATLVAAEMVEEGLVHEAQRRADPQHKAVSTSASPITPSATRW
jgi:hypothetical protein